MRRVLFLLLATLPVVILAQEDEDGAAQPSSAEMIFSNRFHSGSFAIDAARNNVTIGGLFYGSQEYKAAAIGIGKKINFGRRLSLTPAFDAMVLKGEAGEDSEGTHQIVKPAWSTSWHFKTGGGSLALVSEGAVSGTFSQISGSRALFSDGAHLSVQYKRLQVGGTPAFANFGRIRERKVGGRVGVVIYHGFGVAGYALYHGFPVYRAGLFYSREQ